MSVKAYATEYDDVVTIFAEWSQGQIGRVLKELLKDLGGEGSVVSEIELIEMLLGDDIKEHLDALVEG
jgi:hypothetical protein